MFLNCLTYDFKGATSNKKTGFITVRNILKRFKCPCFGEGKWGVSSSTNNLLMLRRASPVLLAIEMHWLEKPISPFWAHKKRLGTVSKCRLSDGDIARFVLPVAPLNDLVLFYHGHIISETGWNTQCRVFHSPTGCSLPDCLLAGVRLFLHHLLNHQLTAFSQSESRGTGFHGRIVCISLRSKDVVELAKNINRMSVSCIQKHRATVRVLYFWSCLTISILNICWNNCQMLKNILYEIENIFYAVFVLKVYFY